MDSGSTAIAILILGSVATFLIVQGADAAMPLLRRSAVREMLSDRGLREASVRRLRTSRSAYEETIHLLSLASSAGVPALMAVLLLRETELSLLAIGLAAASWIALVLMGSLSAYLVRRLRTDRLIVCATGFQLILWPLMPLRALTGWRKPGPVQADANGLGNGTDAELEGEVQLEEISDEPLERHEREMIHAILHLDETPVRELMVPRVDVVSLDLSTPLDQAVPRALESGHSRMPVYEGNPDNIVGILYSRDLLAASLRSSGDEPLLLQDLVRQPFFVPESKRVDEMLSEFQERRVHLAVVVDEYGGVAGIVTIEDLLEEIVGEIEDEFDVDEPEIVRGSADEAVVDARIPVDRFNDEFGVNINSEGFDTLGGFLFSRLGRIPSAGDVVVEDRLRLQVINTVGRRIKKVQVAPVPTSSSTSSNHE